MIGFMITTIEALIALILAFLIAKAGRWKFVNMAFCLFLIFLALWIRSSYLYALRSNPSGYFITFQHRLAYLSATFGAGVFCLFALAFLEGHRPRTAWLLPVSVFTILIAILCTTDLVIKNAQFINGQFFITKGLLFSLDPVSILILGAIAFRAIWLQRKRSQGIDRTRATYLLIGFSFLLIEGSIFGSILPALMGRDITSAYAFLLAIIPILLTGYAMLRHRLLDVRVAIWRTLAYFLTLILFGTPIIVLYAFLRIELKISRDLEIFISVAILALVVFLSPIVLRWTNKLSSRLFFLGFYDEAELLHQTSQIYSSTVDIKAGLVESASLVSDKLKLEKLLIALPDSVTQQEGNWLLGSVRHEEGIEGVRETDARESPLYHIWSVITIDDENPAQDQQTVQVLDEMHERGFEACLPINGPAGKLGVLLVGEKLNRGNLDPLDLDLLKHFTEQAGLFIENYLLSTYLLGQLEELLKTRTELQKADQFKTDIINVTSHELRTPLTILNSFTQILLERYEHCSESQRLEYLGYLSDSCDRLNSILNQFLTVSNLQEGLMGISQQTISMKDVFNNVRASFEPSDHLRINLEIVPDSLTVRADPLYLPLMLKNLVENGIRFSSPEFPVVMSARKSGDKVVISVSDSGEGIDAPDVQRIFSPFTRLEEMDEHHTGTGLGLYLVRLIAELLGTSVSVESQLNQGSLFFFSLPLAILEEQQEYERP